MMHMISQGDLDAAWNMVEHVRWIEDRHVFDGSQPDAGQWLVSDQIAVSYTHLTLPTKRIV